MNRVLVSLFLLPVAAIPVLGTYGCNGNCQTVATGSEENSGSFVFTPTGTSPAVRGPLPDGLDVSGNTGNAIEIDGSFTDGSGTTHDFSFYLQGVVNDGPATIGAGSQACYDDALECAPLTGSVTTSLYNQTCSGGVCAVMLNGELMVSATWSIGTLAAQMSLSNGQTLGQGMCSEQADGS